ncbi:hypothetical protein [Kalamiella sp. sgz302252]|uniref:hypothetical protein n=1 Tax=Pantoea sp. sgz302252 TaxID=3341827 RepID=UPI0036D3DDBF
MAKYMVQSIQSGTHPKITYYRAQSAHPSHSESGAFTEAAITHYVAKFGVDRSTVEKGSYKSDQGVPTGGQVEKI